MVDRVLLRDDWNLERASLYYEENKERCSEGILNCGYLDMLKSKIYR